MSDDEYMSICDRCSREVLASAIGTCEACGASICDDCVHPHEDECVG